MIPAKVVDEILDKLDRLRCDAAETRQMIADQRAMLTEQRQALDRIAMGLPPALLGPAPEDSAPEACEVRPTGKVEPASPAPLDL